MEENKPESVENNSSPNDEIFEQLSLALETEDNQKITEITNELHAADVAEFIENVNYEKRSRLLENLKDDFDPDILVHLEPEMLEEVTELLGSEESAEAIASLPSDEAIEIVSELEKEEQQEILENLPDEYRAAVQEGLNYPENSVGRFMRKKFVSVPEYWNIGQVIDYLRNFSDLPEDFHEVFILDPYLRPKKFVLTSRILRNNRHVPIGDIAQECEHKLRPQSDQEEAANTFEKYSLISAPVVDDKGKMIGVLTIEDVAEIILEEAEEDLMRLGGVMSKDFYSAVTNTVNRRVPWLSLNTINAFVSALIIGMFADSIQALVALAALAPIVAAVVGNSGVQTLTVAVRAIAKGDLTFKNAYKVITKEVFVSFINGFVVGLLAAVICYILYRDLQLTIIFAIAINVCFVGAGLVASIIPITLERFKIDPAIASSAFVVAATDAISFFVFLGLATHFMMH